MEMSSARAVGRGCPGLWVAARVVGLGMVRQALRPAGREPRPALQKTWDENRTGFTTGDGILHQMASPTNLCALFIL